MNEFQFIDILIVHLILEQQQNGLLPPVNALHRAANEFLENEKVPELLATPGTGQHFVTRSIEKLRGMGCIVGEIIDVSRMKMLQQEIRVRYGKDWSHWPLSIPIRGQYLRWANARIEYE